MKLSISELICEGGLTGVKLLALSIMCHWERETIRTSTHTQAKEYISLAQVGLPLAYSPWNRSGSINSGASHRTLPALVEPYVSFASC